MFLGYPPDLHKMMNDDDDPHHGWAVRASPIGRRQNGDRCPPRKVIESRTGRPSGEDKVGFYSQTDISKCFGCFRRAT